MIQQILFIFLSMLAAQVSWAAGDAAHGETLTQACMGCHGVQGNSQSGQFPKLAGQSAKYIAKQLQDIKTGKRAVLPMTGLLNNFSDQDFLDIGAYFQQQTISGGAAKKEWVALGQTVYRSGKMKEGVPACSACHGAKGEGVPAAGFPSLKGQHADYIAVQLKAFRSAGREDLEGSAQRTNDGDSMMMRSVAAKLSDKEIQAVASYISGLR